MRAARPCVETVYRIQQQLLDSPYKSQNAQHVLFGEGKKVLLRSGLSYAEKLEKHRIRACEQKISNLMEKCAMTTSLNERIDLQGEILCQRRLLDRKVETFMHGGESCQNVRSILAYYGWNTPYVVAETPNNNRQYKELCKQDVQDSKNIKSLLTAAFKNDIEGGDYSQSMHNHAVTLGRHRMVYEEQSTNACNYLGNQKYMQSMLGSRGPNVLDRVRSVFVPEQQANYKVQQQSRRELPSRYEALEQSTQL